VWWWRGESIHYVYLFGGASMPAEGTRVRRGMEARKETYLPGGVGEQVAEVVSPCQRNVRRRKREAAWCCLPGSKKRRERSSV